MQMTKARRIDAADRTGDSDQANGSPARAVRQQPARGDDLPSDGCSLELTDEERTIVEERFAELTRREREVIFALCSGGTNEGMAERLCIALPTLRTHLMRLNQKLGTSSKGDVVRLVAAHLLHAYRSERLRPVRREPEPARPANAVA